MSKYSKAEMIKGWPQGAAELSGFVRTLRRNNAVITAAQIEMAIQMANAYLDFLQPPPKQGVFIQN